METSYWSMHGRSARTTLRWLAPCLSPIAGKLIPNWPFLSRNSGIRACADRWLSRWSHNQAIETHHTHAGPHQIDVDYDKMVLPKLNIRKKRKPPQLVNDPDDEEQTDVPKLPADPPKALVPYPTKQLIVLACCRFSEPVAMTSSFPYLFFMIRDFHLTDNEKEIGRYAGFLASCFSFAQFFSGTFTHSGNTNR